jgi:hypothetical protein
MYKISLASNGTLSGYRTGIAEPLWTVGSASNASRIEMIMEVLHSNILDSSNRYNNEFVTFQCGVEHSFAVIIL